MSTKSGDEQKKVKSPTQKPEWLQHIISQDGNRTDKRMPDAVIRLNHRTNSKKFPIKQLAPAKKHQNRLKNTSTVSGEKCKTSTDDGLQWIAYDTCLSWFHGSCSGLPLRCIHLFKDTHIFVILIYVLRKMRNGELLQPSEFFF